MSRSTWRKRFTYFIRGDRSGTPLTWWEVSRFSLWLTTTFLSVWLLLSVGQGLWSWRLTSREMDYQYNQRAQQNRAKAALQIARSCAVPHAPADIVGMCILGKIETYREQAVSDEDLEAQQQMARWTVVMGVVGVVSVPLSAFGLLALWFSLSQTRQAITTDREVGHAQVRAYLTIEPGPPDDIRPGHSSKADITIKNTGQSPAYFVKYIATIRVEPYPTTKDNSWFVFPSPEQIEPIGMTLPSQGDFVAEAKSTLPLTDENIRSAMGGGDKRIYLACIVYYKDVFGVQRITRFCAYLDDSGKTAPVPDGRSLKAFAWMIAHINNEAT